MEIIMRILDFLNDYSGLLSLIASIIIAIVVHKLQKSQEAENRKQDERRSEERLKEEARIFIIDNQSEIDYLPLCVMASNANPYKNHKRNIFNKFNRSSVELKREILKQRNIPISIFDNKNSENDYKHKSVISEFIDSLEKDCKLHNFGQSFLYGGAKYFHRGFERYAGYKVENISINIFEVPNLSPLLEEVRSVKDGVNKNASLTLYVDRYLEFVLKNKEDTAGNPELLPQKPPFDMMFDKLELRDCKEEVICFWVMQFVISACVAFFRHDIVGKDSAEWRQINADGAEIETFEDLYYEALLMLYTAYVTNKKDR